jgi:hypothetical protein
MAPHTAAMHLCLVAGFVGRNRFIAPLREDCCPEPEDTGRGAADRRNKAIAPYGCVETCEHGGLLFFLLLTSNKRRRIVVHGCGGFTESGNARQV